MFICGVVDPDNVSNLCVAMPANVDAQSVEPMPMVPFVSTFCLSVHTTSCLRFALSPSKLVLVRCVLSAPQRYTVLLPVLPMMR